MRMTIRRLSALMLALLALLLIGSAQADSSSWSCPGCGRQGNTGNYCANCGTARPQTESWSCVYCGNQNRGGSYCVNCGAARQRGNTVPQTVFVGDQVVFGRYEQDGNPSNGKEPIQWRVLDVQDGKALLISSYALEALAYNNSKVSCTWSSCTLRTWLNQTFYRTAFTYDEQQAIALTRVDNSSAQGNRSWSTANQPTTEDKVFILSYAESSLYFSSKEDRCVYPTAYLASRQDVYTRYNTGYCWWWLRSPGNAGNKACFVNTLGLRDNHLVDQVYGPVRPCIWVDASAL